MKYQGLDLNLLVTLDVLLNERNVSRAAERLCLSQSAASGALARLREYFEDELLVQAGRSMMLTPRAQELADSVRNVLLQVDGTIIKRPEFDPATSQREVRIMASDFMVITAFSHALRQITLMAPEMTFSLIPPQVEPREMLEQGEVDFLAMADTYHSPHHPSAHLFSDDYRAVVWGGNTLVGDTVSIDQFLTMKHVAVRYSPVGPSFEGWFIERFGNERHVEVVAGSYAAVPFLLTGTNRIALMHRRLAEHFAALMPLRLLPPPVEIPRLNQGLQWHVYNDNDACLKWVRSHMIRLIAETN